MHHRGYLTSGPVVGGGTGACGGVADRLSPGASNTGFDDLIDAVISPGGASVYAISQNDDAVVQFDRDPGTGELTFVGMLQRRGGQHDDRRGSVRGHSV